MMRIQRLFTHAALLAALAVPFTALAQHEAPHGTEAREGHGGGEGHGSGSGEGHGAAKGEHAAAHGEEHGPIAAINWVDFGNHEQLPYAAAAINFVLLLAIYVKYGKKPVADALKKRKTDIAHDIEEAARVKREAEERAKKYQADLGNLDQDLEVARQALVEAGKKERERIVAEAKERAVRMKRDADTLLVQEAKQKNQDLTIETIERATSAAEQILKSKLTQEDHLRLAEEFLADLGKRSVDSAVRGAA